MHLASIVSERFGFAIPGGYARMTEAGLLSHARPSSAAKPSGKPAAKASAKSKPKPASTRARALATCDVHWLTAEEIVARIEKHGGRAWRPRWPLDFVFVPFAENREGDEWGWAPSL